MSTPLTLKTLGDLDTLGVDTIIDVRAPAEFAEDHLPGAINLPVLSDAQRHDVGTIYTQQSPFLARKIGGALVAQNTATHLQGPLADLLGDWQPLVYCWRGGQRSGAFSTILEQVGWRVKLLDGGYRSYRRLIVDMLYETPLHHRLMLISGGTGTAKTELLHHLAQAGAQMIDLEGLANHRGSLFGSMGTPQPAQKMFETRLAAQLREFDPERLTWVEAESSKVGECIVPPSLWALMRAAPRVEITAPLDARAQYLTTAYADLTENTKTLRHLIDLLRAYHHSETITKWHGHADAGEFTLLARDLIAQHYDPRYRASAEDTAAPTQSIALTDLDTDTLQSTANHLHAMFN